MNTRRRNILVILILFVGLVVVGLVYFLTSFNKVTVQIGVSPVSSVLMLDGKSIKPGVHSVEKGTHTLTASHQYFENASLTFDTNSIDLNDAIYILPEANSAEAKQWLLDHNEDMLVRERASAIVVSNQQAAALEKYPIMAHLPQNTIDYRIDYNLGADGNIIYNVVIKPFGNPDTPQYNATVDSLKKKATDALIALGAKITETNITYTIQ